MLSAVRCNEWRMAGVVLGGGVSTEYRKIGHGWETVVDEVHMALAEPCGDGESDSACCLFTSVSIWLTAAVRLFYPA